MPYSEASFSSTSSFWWSYMASVGLWTIACFMALKAFSCDTDHTNGASFFNRFWRGWTMFVMLGMYLDKYCTIPKTRLTSFMLAGLGSLVIASTFWGSINIPFSEMMWPMKVMESLASSNFSLFNFTPNWSHLAMKNFSRSSCSFFDFPWMMMSSRMQTTPGMSPKSSLILLSNISADTLRPKGSRRNRNRAKHVWNVVSSEDSSSSWTCQYPFCKSNFVKTFDELSSWRTSSRMGMV